MRAACPTRSDQKLDSSAIREKSKLSPTAICPLTWKSKKKMKRCTTITPSRQRRRRRESYSRQLDSGARIREDRARCEHRGRADTDEVVNRAPQGTVQATMILTIRIQNFLFFHTTVPRDIQSRS